jgi:ribosomal protein S18 acetylase RimI-like enzyme
MAGLKFLVDTNVFIALEDPRLVPTPVAELAQKAQLHSIALFVDEASIADINRDPDPGRRAITLSKLHKFPVVSGVAHRPASELDARFGAASSDNDRCDVQMLDTLDLDVVDFLITEDVGLHKRAARANLHRRVFTVREALLWIQRTFDPKEFRLPYVVSRKVHQISATDPIFKGLREDYAGFDIWLSKCRNEHRDCWTVEIDGQLAGIVIRKDETHAEAGTRSVGDRVLKLCTFKMKLEYQGEKFGEQLLKKALWFAQSNGYEVVYLTVFPKHQFLIELLKPFGFEATRTLANGELLMERTIAPDNPTVLPGGVPPLSVAFGSYPRFYEGPAVAKYVIPIQPAFHAILFPEIAELTPLPLFPSDQSLWSASAAHDRTPGNTIRKVYICRSPTRTLIPGAVLLFYMSKSPDYRRSQSITSVGVVERVEFASAVDQLMRLVGRRSVYSEEDLKAMAPSDASSVLVVEFLLHGHFDPELRLDTLLSSGAFSGRPPQSIKRLDESAYRNLRSATKMSFE